MTTNPTDTQLQGKTLERCANCGQKIVLLGNKWLHSDQVLLGPEDSRQCQLFAARRAAVAGPRGDGDDRAVRNFRWAYQLLLALAKRRLAEANANRQHKNDWPAGQQWHEMVGSSHSIFLRGARKEAGIPEDAFMGVIRALEYDVDDLYERAATAPAPVNNCGCTDHDPEVCLEGEVDEGQRYCHCDCHVSAAAPSAATAVRCVNCDHEEKWSMNNGGICDKNLTDCMRYAPCGCKCEFAPAESTQVEGKDRFQAAAQDIVYGQEFMNVPAVVGILKRHFAAAPADLQG